MDEKHAPWVPQCKDEDKMDKDMIDEDKMDERDDSKKC